MNYLTEAFKQMELLESEQFTFDKDGAVKLANFLDDDVLMDFETIIDPEAKTKEDLKTSYMGNVIFECPICKQLIYKDPESVTIDEEEQLANVEEPCPYCFEAGGYEIIGQVAPYKEVTVEGADEDTKVEVDGKIVDTDTDPETEEDRDITDDEKEESLNESLFDKLVQKFPELADESDVRARRHTRDNEDIEDSQRFPVEGTKQVNLVERRCAKRRHTRDNEDLEDSQRYPIESPVGTKGLKEGIDDNNEEISTKDEKMKTLGRKSRHSRDDEDLEDSQRYPIESPAPAQTGLREGMEDISITTDDQVIKVKATPREDKETIQPIKDETKEVIEETPEVEEETPIEDIPVEAQDVEIEDFDEESFNNLGESYLKQVYGNVNSFKTIDVKKQKNNLIVEGVISFNSGKKAKTNFIFEAKDATKNGKLRFSGLNENISKNKKAFTLTGNLKGNKLISESLNYNYSTKDSNGKPKRLYGTVKTTK